MRQVSEVSFAINSYCVQVMGVFFGTIESGWAFCFSCILILESLPSRATVKILTLATFFSLGFCFSA